MKRRTFVAELLDGNRTIDTRTAHAWNSAIRASEAMAREHALARGVILEGSDPKVWGRPGDPGASYRRYWRSGDGIVLRVDMAEVHS